MFVTIFLLVLISKLAVLPREHGVSPCHLLSQKAAFYCTVMAKQWETGPALDVTAAWLINKNVSL